MNQEALEPVAVVTFTTAGMIGTVYSCDPGEPAREAAKYYRRYYPSVRIFTYDELHNALEKESELRRYCYD